MFFKSFARPTISKNNSGRGRCRKQTKRQSHMEMLESRNLMAAGDVFLTGPWWNQTLKIEGSGLNDTTHVIQSGSNVHVKHCSYWQSPWGASYPACQEQDFSNWGQITKIEYTGGDGDDYFSASSTDIPVEAHGGAGNDIIYGSQAEDQIYGDIGNDWLFSLGGSDELYGGTGNTFLDELFSAIGIADNDYLSGGSGDDLLNGGYGNNTISGGSNYDSVDYSWLSEGLSASLNPGTVWTRFTNRINDRVSNIDRFLSGSGDDYIYGSSASDWIVAGDGDDQIWGFGGSDTLEGGPGKDTLHGGPGNDRLIGGLDDDRLYGDSGADKIYGDTDDFDDYKWVRDDSRSTSYGGQVGGIWTYRITVGTGGNDRIYGGSGNDTIYGNTGNDHIVGGTGRDYLYGSAATGNYHSDMPSQYGLTKYRFTVQGFGADVVITGDEGRMRDGATDVVGNAAVAVVERRDNVAAGISTVDEGNIRDVLETRDRNGRAVKGVSIGVYADASVVVGAGVGSGLFFSKGYNGQVQVHAYGTYNVSVGTDVGVSVGLEMGIWFVDAQGFQGSSTSASVSQGAVTVGSDGFVSLSADVPLPYGMQLEFEYSRIASRGRTTGFVARIGVGIGFDLFDALGIGVKITHGETFVERIN